MLKFRKANIEDLDKIEQIYNDIHTEEESGTVVIGWIRGVYPTRKVAQDALLRGDLFVAEDGDEVVASAVINNIQMPQYVYGDWKCRVSNERICVLHTLVVSPKYAGRGYGGACVDFYEKYARESGCDALRIDTNARNQRARSLYKKLGFDEVGAVGCDFNGIESVTMILLEKIL